MSSVLSSISDYFTEKTAVTALAVALSSTSLTGCFATGSSVPIDRVFTPTNINRSTLPARKELAREIKQPLRLRNCGDFNVTIGEPCQRSNGSIYEPAPRPRY